MDKNTLLRYKGYASTPSLWLDSNLLTISLIDLPAVDDTTLVNFSIRSKRLGKIVEEFVFYQLKQLKSVKILAENIQIQQDKLTIGEFDALLCFNKNHIHLEIVYKFYLYDNTIENDDRLAHWIGPNRKDSLIQKMDKLEQKQFPLLYNLSTQPYLEKYKIKLEDIKQNLLFKAQLFVPYEHKISCNIEPLNKDCIVGFYIPFNNLDCLKDYKFYIPKKLDWLISPHTDVHWLNIEQATILIKEFIDNQQSPLIWLNNHVDCPKKCFITWW